MDSKQTGSPRILIVDDEPGVLNSMIRLFHDDSIEVLTASGGRAALELLQESGPVELVISDFRMPGMNGVEFLQRMMQQWPDTRRAILSGFPDSNVLLAAVNEGRVHRFLVKPWDNDTIRTIALELLEEYRLIVDFRHHAEEVARNNRLLSRTNENLSALLTDVLTTMRREAEHDDSQVRSLPSQSVRRLHESLSRRESEIMLAVASGQSLKAIAIDLGLSIKTASTYKKRIFTKMGFKHDADLIVYTLKNNLLPHDPM